MVVHVQNTDLHARAAVGACGPETLRVLREAARAGCSEMAPDEVVDFIAGILPPAAFVQAGPAAYVTFGVADEATVRVALSDLRETFFHRLLSREVMCA